MVAAAPSSGRQTSSKRLQQILDLDLEDGWAVEPSAPSTSSNQQSTTSSSSRRRPNRASSHVDGADEGWSVTPSRPTAPTTPQQPEVSAFVSARPSKLGRKAVRASQQAQETKPASLHSRPSSSKQDKTAPPASSSASKSRGNVLDDDDDEEDDEGSKGSRRRGKEGKGMSMDLMSEQGVLGMAMLHARLKADEGERRQCVYACARVTV